MKKKTKQSGLYKRLRKPGFTLTELLITIVIIVMLAAVSIPAIDAFMNSMGSTGSATALINAALSSARAMAIKDQRYVGVRFQWYFDPRDPRPLAPRDMYMIFIVNDTSLFKILPTGEKVSMGFGFRAIEGIKPVKLPPNIGVTDLTIVNQRNTVNPVNPSDVTDLLNPVGFTASQINGKLDVLTDAGQRNLFDITTFSIIFSPSGNLIVHSVLVINKDSKVLGDEPPSKDDVFNTIEIVGVNAVQEIATFWQDEDDMFSALGPEPSRRYFLIFERDKYRRALSNARLYSDYLLPLINTKGLTLINPYTGTLIETK